MNSVRAFAFDVLEISPRQFRSLAADAADHYRFRVANVRGKVREIAEPDKSLMQVLDRLYSRVLSKYALPPCIQSRRGASAFSNAGIHVNQPWVIRLDVANFFPNITERQVRRVWRDRFNLGSELAELLTKLTTLHGAVPQGAPTSPSLGNLVLISADQELDASCKRCGVRYSRWIDDLTFSGGQALKQIGFAMKVIAKHGFRIGRGKIIVAGRNQKRIVTGFDVSGRRPLIPSALVNVMFLNIDKVDATAGAIDKELVRSLRGSIGYVQQAEPALARRLQARLDSRLQSSSSRYTGAATTSIPLADRRK